jgi:hypothetical protein
MFTLTQEETNLYAMHQINKLKKTRGPSDTQLYMCTVEYSLTAGNKKILCNNHTHEPVTQVISAGLLEFASDYSHSMRIFYWNVSKQVSRIIDDVPTQ